jgi:hypothetical protein
VSDHIELRIRPRRVLLTVFLTCVAIELLLVWLDYYVNYGQWTRIGALRRLVNITREDGLAGWFQPVQTLLVALTAWAIWVVDRRHSPGLARSLGWAVVATFFTYMAVDDGTKLHERVGTAFRVMNERGRSATLGDVLLGIFPSYSWQIVFLPAFAALGAFTVIFLWRRLADRFSRLLVVAGIGCFVVAVGLDFVEGLPRRHPLNLQTWAVERLDFNRFSRRRFGRSATEAAAHFSKSIEETLEEFGTTLLWLAFLQHLMSRSGELRLRFAPGTTEQGGPTASVPPPDVP